MIDWKTAKDVRFHLNEALRVLENKYLPEYSKVSMVRSLVMLADRDVEAKAEPEPKPRRGVHWTLPGEGLGNYQSFEESKIGTVVGNLVRDGATYIRIGAAQ